LRQKLHLMTTIVQMRYMFGVPEMRRPAAGADASLFG